MAAYSLQAFQSLWIIDEYEFYLKNLQIMSTVYGKNVCCGPQSDKIDTITQSPFS